MSDTMRDTPTAMYLGRFRKELIDQGFTPDEAFGLVKQAAALMLEDGGLVVAA